MPDMTYEQHYLFLKLLWWTSPWTWRRQSFMSSIWRMVHSAFSSGAALSEILTEIPRYLAAIFTSACCRLSVTGELNEIKRGKKGKCCYAGCCGSHHGARRHLCFIVLTLQADFLSKCSTLHSHPSIYPSIILPAVYPAMCQGQLVPVYTNTLDTWFCCHHAKETEFNVLSSGRQCRQLHRVQRDASLLSTCAFMSLSTFIWGVQHIILMTTAASKCKWESQNTLAAQWAVMTPN